MRPKVLPLECVERQLGMEDLGDPLASLFVPCRDRAHGKRSERNRYGETAQTKCPHPNLSIGPGAQPRLQISLKPAAMNDAMRSFTAPKSSERHSPPDSLSIRPVRASVSISAPVTK